MEENPVSVEEKVVVEEKTEQNNIDIKEENDKKSNIESELNTIEQLNKAIESDDTNSLYYYKRAELYSEQSDYNNALKDYDLAINFSKTENMDLFIKKSKVCVELKKYKEAIDAVTGAIKIDPVNPDLYYERALLYQQKGDDINYLKNINLTLDYEPEYKKAYTSRAYYYASKQNFKEAYRDAMSASDFTRDIDNKYLLSVISFNLGKYSETISLLTDVYDIKQKEKEIDYYFGISFAKMKNYDNAIKYLTKALAKGLKYEEVYYYLAESCSCQYNFKTALEYINKAIDLNSENYKNYWLRAKIYLDLDNIEFSLKNFDKATSLNCKDKDLFFDKIRVLEISGKNKDVIEAYSKLISVYENDGKLYYKRGLTHKRMGRSAEAQKDFMMAKNLGENVREDFLIQTEQKKENKFVQPQQEQQQEQYEQQEQPEQKEQPEQQEQKEQQQEQTLVQEQTPVIETKKIVEQKVEAEPVKPSNDNIIKVKPDPKTAMIHLNRGNINFQKHKYKEALEDLTKAIAYNPKDVQGYLLRAEIYVEIRDFQAAMQDFLKVVEISPKAIFAYVKLGDIYREQFNFDRGEYYYKKAIEINPRNANAYYGYAKLCEDNGKKELAIDNYKKAASLDIKLSKECNMKVLQLKS